MTYVSLFDKLEDATAFGNSASDSSDQAGKKILLSQMAYFGSLGNVLDQLEMDLGGPLINSSTIARVIFDAPRIVRAAIDHKIVCPTVASERLLSEALILALKIYASSSSLPEEVRRFRTVVMRTSPELLYAPLAQSSDYATYEASKPERSRTTTFRMADLYKGQDLLFIALAHGGVAAGMDVFLRYCDLVKKVGSDLFVARFSTQKLGDKIPRVTEREKTTLANLKGDRQVVIFDEDTCSGRTLFGAAGFFSEHVFHGAVATEANFGVFDPPFDPPDLIGLGSKKFPIVQKLIFSVLKTNDLFDSYADIHPNNINPLHYAAYPDSKPPSVPVDLSDSSAAFLFLLARLKSLPQLSPPAKSPLSKNDLSDLLSSFTGTGLPFPIQNINKVLTKLPDHLVNKI